MLASMASYANSAYGLSLRPAYRFLPPLLFSTKLAKIRYGSISSFGLPSLKMVAQPSFHGDSEIWGNFVSRSLTA